MAEDEDELTYIQSFTSFHLSVGNDANAASAAPESAFPPPLEGSSCSFWCRMGQAEGEGREDAK